MPSGKKRKRHKVATAKRKKGVELMSQEERLILNHSSLISLIST